MPDRLSPGYIRPDEGKLPPDWRIERLSTLCTFTQGGRLSLNKQRDYEKTGIPAYSAAGQDGFVADAEFKETRGVILSAIGANCGHCFYAEGDWTTLHNVYAIIPNESIIDSKFLFYRVNRASYWPRSGSAQPFIKPSDIRSCWLAFPPIRQQQLIAKILDTLDTQIRRTEEIIAKLEQVRQGLLTDLLTRGIDENGELRPSPEEAPELYKDSPLGRIPKEWEVTRLRHLAINSVIGPFGSDLVASDYRPEGLPVVFVRDVKTSGFQWNSAIYVTHQKGRELAAHNVRAGDVSLTKMGQPPCVACVYPDWMPDGVVTADIVRVRIDPQRVRAHWIAKQANAEQVKRQVAAITGGVTRPKVTLHDVRDIFFAVPNIEEQDRIITILTYNENMLATERQHLQLLEKLKLGLMDDLLTGRVRVTPLLEQAEQATA